MRKNEYVLFLFCKKIKSWHGVCFINKCKMQKANKLKCVEIEIWMTKRGGAMIGLIIATHGNSSVELIKDAEMFAGPLSQCKAWTLNPGDDIEKGEQMLEEYVDELDQGDGVLIMTDLFGGTPSNLSLKIAMKKGNAETLTGVNLPMIIQFITERETQTLDELIESCIEAAQDGIKSQTKIMKERR